MYVVVSMGQKKVGIIGMREERVREIQQTKRPSEEEGRKKEDA